ncbi:MAG TPA: Nif3-like dinuclear metal center hexameric protein, partial [Saprospiraceae bacterium]|nr:Nif3-like dinuclear metal center hexameric protein [Saprospiraceae bacterium]
MTIKDVVQVLEQIAPPHLQESYDNAGLITGHPDTPLSGVLCCLDSTEAVVEEAVRKNCNLVVAHHPIVFRGLKRFNGSNYVERTVISALRHDVALYAIHTNLDNVYRHGVNEKIAEKIGLLNTRTALVLLYTAYQLPIVVWVLFGFFQTLPQELERAALIDGYTRFQALTKIVLPLSKTGMVAAGLFVLTFAWNDFVVALVAIWKAGGAYIP